MSLSSIASPHFPPANLEGLDESSDRSSSGHDRGSTTTQHQPDYTQKSVEHDGTHFQTASTFAPLPPLGITQDFTAVKMEPIDPNNPSNHDTMPPQIAPPFGAPAFGATGAPFNNPYMVPAANPFAQSTSPPQTAPRLFHPSQYQGKYTTTDRSELTPTAMPMTSLAFSNPPLPPTPDTAVHSFSPPSMNAFGTHLPQLDFSPNTTMSPQLISPVSQLSSQLSDLSPSTNSPWLYSPAYFTSSTPSQTAALPQTTPPPGAGMGFVNGFPYPVPARPALRVLGRKSTRGVGTDSPHSPRRPDDDDDEELVDIDEAQQRSGGGSIGGGSLGFTPVVTDQNERIVIPARREEVRNARIESEQKRRLTEVWQRRRNELREGFERLRDVLPPSNQRVSKALLLDRGVAHIQSLDSANRYLSVELETARKEAEDLRRMNHQLAQSLAARTRTATPVQ
ncbi:Viral myc transforming protein [Vanrija pseudolonga]|uniref:Viral myc transforming protein n=1 Tax=Vanrija pseudolonga TaxID=143232 RepID=A0AAF0Y5Z2_9TREE|nr:Viral myc transforming protein [Vanrija pseudolonga]